MVDSNEKTPNIGNSRILPNFLLPDPQKERLGPIGLTYLVGTEICARSARKNLGFLVIYKGKTLKNGSKKSSKIKNRGPNIWPDSVNIKNQVEKFGRFGP